MYWVPKEQSIRRHPVNISFPKKLVQHIRDVLLCNNRNKISVPVFYLSLNHRLALSRFNSYAPKLVPIFYSGIKHEYICFIS